VDLLQAGEVVALPTETVYGLAANAFSETAVAKIFAAKDRPNFDPLIVHLPNVADLERVAVIPEDISKDVRRLAQHFWPGPLTLILPKHPRIPDLVTAGLPTVAVRISANPIFTRVIKALGYPLAAPSANRFGRISPTSASAVLAELDGRIPMIVDGGACSRGLESTIIRIEPGPPGKKAIFHVLRAGPVTPDELKEYGKVKLPKPGKKEEAAAPTAPGQLPSHYAPVTPLRLVEDPKDFTPEPGKRYALLSYRGSEDDGYLNLTEWAHVSILSPGSGKLAEAAVRLYFVLRQLDALGVDEIIAEPISEVGLGVAMMDRLRRASVRVTG